MAKVGKTPKGEMLSSGHKTTDTLIRTGEALLWGFALRSGSAASTLVIYDNTSASGTRLIEMVRPADDGIAIFFPKPIKADTGLYLDIGGTATQGTVYYEIIE